MPVTTRLALPGLICLTLAMAAGGAHAQFAPQSSAVAIDATFQTKGIATELGPIAPVAGEALGSYDFTQTVAAVNESVALAPQVLTPTVYLIGHGLTSNASSMFVKSIVVSAHISRGDTSIEQANMALSVNPPPGSTVPTPLPALTIAARAVTSSADFNTGVPEGIVAGGAASIGSLTVSGQLLGGASLHFSGPAAPNTVIFESPALTITLNRQFRTGLISCSPKCVFTPYSINVSAVDVSLNNAAVGASKVSGDITIGGATAR